MSRYNRTNEAPPTVRILNAVRYDAIDSISLNEIEILTNRNQYISTNNIVATFGDQAIGSSVLASLYVIQGLSDIVNNIESVSTIADGLEDEASTLRNNQLSQTSTVNGITKIINSQTNNISSFIGNTKYIDIQANILLEEESTTSSKIDDIANIIYGVDLSTISTMIDYTSKTFIDISSQTVDVQNSISSLLAEQLGVSTDIEALSVGGFLLQSTKASLIDYTAISAIVYTDGIEIHKIGDGSTINNNLINTVSIGYYHISTSLIVGALLSDFNILSVNVLTNSTSLGNITNSYSTTASNLSSLSTKTQELSTIYATYHIGTANYNNLSTSVLSNSTSLGLISDGLCSAIYNLSTTSTAVQGISTTLGDVSRYLTLSNFWNLSTTVLNQSTTIDNILHSLCTQIANVSSLSSSVSKINVNTSNFIKSSDFAGLSSFVLGNSTTIRGISDSLSAFTSNLSNTSSFIYGFGSVTDAFFSNFYGISTQILNNSTSLGSYNIQISTLSTTYNSISVVTTYMSTAVNTKNIANSSIRYGLGNTITQSKSFAGGTSNAVLSELAVAAGFKNSLSNGSGNAFGYCNMTSSIYTMAVGEYASPRVANAMSLAGGYVILPISRGIVPGCPQSLTLNMFTATNTYDTYSPLVYWNDNNKTTASNIGLHVIRSNFLMHSVYMELIGYQQVSAGSPNGNGFYRADYQFFNYWDNLSTPSLYLCDGGSGATSVGALSLTSLNATNKLYGATTVTATVYPTVITSNSLGAYAIAVKTNIIAPGRINWLAKLSIGELGTSVFATPDWPVNWYNSQNNCVTTLSGPSGSPTTAWSIGFGCNIFKGSPLIDGLNNIYACLYSQFYKLSNDGTLLWTLTTGGISENGCLTPDKCILFGSSIYLNKTTPYTSITAPSITWSYVNFNTNMDNALTIASAPVIDDSNTAYIKGQATFIRSTISIQHNIAAVDSNGNKVWAVDVIYENPAIPPAYDFIRAMSGITVGKYNFIYYTTSNGALYARNKTTGAIAWTALNYSIGSYAWANPPIVDSNGTVYQMDANNVLYAFNGSNGTVLWSNDRGITTAGFNTNIVIGPNKIYYTIPQGLGNRFLIVALSNDGTFLYSGTNAKLQADAPPGYPYSAPRRIVLDANDIMYASTRNSYFAINGSDFTTRWDFTTNGVMDLSNNLAVSVDRNNRVYFGASDCNFYALQ